MKLSRRIHFLEHRRSLWRRSRDSDDSRFVFVIVKGVEWQRRDGDKFNNTIYYIINFRLKCNVIYSQLVVTLLIWSIDDFMSYGFLMQKVIPGDW